MNLNRCDLDLNRSHMYGCNTEHVYIDSIEHVLFGLKIELACRSAYGRRTGSCWGSWATPPSRGESYSNLNWCADMHVEIQIGVQICRLTSESACRYACGRRTGSSSRWRATPPCRGESYLNLNWRADLHVLIQIAVQMCMFECELACRFACGRRTGSSWAWRAMPSSRGESYWNSNWRADVYFEI